MESCDISVKALVSIIEYLEGCLQEIRTRFVSFESIREEDEIVFFKEIKPESREIGRASCRERV